MVICIIYQIHALKTATQNNVALIHSYWCNVGKGHFIASNFPRAYNTHIIPIINLCIIHVYKIYTVTMNKTAMNNY